MTAAGWGVVLAVFVLALVVLGRWIGGLLRLVLRSAGGFFLLYLIQPIGLGIGANGVNALVLGLLGMPGFGLLLMLQWVLGG